jgi:endogenous inhibitor of DNA gyrase (YacG/DUF329 family)
MGVYDYVDYPPQACPRCGTMVSGWQSKDASCMLETVPVSQVRHFYANCPECGRWMEFEVVVKAYDVVFVDVDTA